jgi:hypothetical protein
VDRKWKYAEIVKEVHRPVTDRFKVVEMERLKERLKHPSRPKVYTSDQKIIRKVTLKKPRTPVSPAPVGRTPRDPRQIDYIQELRAKRLEKQHSEIIPLDISLDTTTPSHSQLEQLKEQTRRIEQAAKKKERDLAGGAQVTLGQIETVEEVNNAILVSIKAKLKALDAVIPAPEAPGS